MSINTALLADDEPALRAHLREKLQQLWPELEVVAEVDNGVDALEYIRSLKPDVAFLDIRMPGINGMRVAQQIDAATRVVFVTAYDQYAVAAFQQNAVDYLLKPYNDERLQETLRRLHESGSEGVNAEQLQALLQQLSQQSSLAPKPMQWLRVSRGEEVFLIHLDDVIFFRSGDKYTSVYTRKGESLIRTPLKDLETMLDGERFWRIHRACIVNAACIDSARRTLDGRYHLRLKDCDQTLDVSRAYAHLFKQM